MVGAVLLERSEVSLAVDVELPAVLELAWHEYLLEIPIVAALGVMR